MRLRLRQLICFVSLYILVMPSTAHAQSPDLAQYLKLDYFRFYNLTPVETTADVGVRGMFDREMTSVSINVTRPAMEYFAAPVSIGGSRLLNPTVSLVWYKSEQRQKEPMRDVELKNRFGRHAIRIGSPVALLFPTADTERSGRMTDRIEHYKVYPVLDGSPIQRKVSLEDRFTSQGNVIVGRMAFLAVPVEAMYANSVRKVRNQLANITIYATDSPENAGMQHSTTDQFGRHTMELVKPTMLGLPTTMIDFRNIPQ